MSYESLSKIYRKSESEHKEIYQRRFNAPNTIHFPFSIKQFNRKEAFPAFFCYTEDIFLLTEKIFNQCNKISVMLQYIPNLVVSQFELSCIVEEVKATNEIEGVRSSRRELKEIINGNSSMPRFFDIVEKYNLLFSNKELNFKTCADVRNFYDNFVLAEVVANKPNYKPDGKIFRKNPVDISSGVKTIHRGIYPEEKIIDAMEIALKILNDESTPLLVRLSVFHYYFEYIHPFYDGNGRIGRFIASYYLAKNFNNFAALRLSFVINRRKKKYYELFKTTTEKINCGDLTPFVHGFISIIAETFDDLEQLLNRKMLQFSTYQEKLKQIAPSEKLSHEIYFILFQTSLFFGQGATLETLMKLTGKSRNTIKSRLNPAISKGDIISVEGKKNTYKLNFKIFL